MTQYIMKEQEFESGVFGCDTWQKVFRLLREHKRIVVLLIFFNTVPAVTDVTMPLLNHYALNTYIDDRTGADTLPAFILVYVGMILAQCLLVYLLFRLTARVESDFGKNLREKCFRKLQGWAFSYPDRTVDGWLMARTTSGATRLTETLAWASVDAVQGIFVILGISVVMLLVNWQMASCVLVVVPLLWFVSLYFHHHILSAQRQSRKANSRITAFFTEGINGARATKTLGIEQQNYNEFQKKADDMKRCSMRALRVNAISRPIVYLLSAVVIALLLYVGGEQILLKTIQSGTLTMFISHAQLFFGPLGQIARVFAGIQTAWAGAEHVIALLEEEIEITDYPDIIEHYGTLSEERTDAYEPLYGDAVFDHIDFYYYGSEPALRDFYLQVKKGQAVVLVGETDSGKSTIVNLLYRLYGPCSGCIPMDGKNLRERGMDWLHSHTGHILQTPSLFSGTIRDGIRYGRRGASDEEVEQVARLIQTHDFISRMEKGYDTKVGEDGDCLSAGQRQLTSFARAMLCDLAVVILDEAISSINTESKKTIQYAMDQLLHGHTSFVVAHRLSTVISADIIVMLQHGVIIEQGTHEELMAKQGYYYELFVSQYRQERTQRCME